MNIYSGKYASVKEAPGGSDVILEIDHSKSTTKQQKTRNVCIILGDIFQFGQPKKRWCDLMT